MMSRPDISVSPDGEVITIDGLRFHREFFKYLAEGEIGAVARLVSRGDGVVTLERIDLTRGAIGWAAWHPTRGFDVPHQCEGAVAWFDLDSAAREVRSLNAEDRTTNRTGWRATKVKLLRVPV